ncbi:MAG: endonuclease/exonuclease/phosphatase family protein [Bacteroidetes bacterium]|nr:endonuclease/exonuclease/phosphatase family protein [Bacteroidota bacterium]
MLETLLIIGMKSAGFFWFFTLALAIGAFIFISFRMEKKPFAKPRNVIRFATFNVSLYCDSSGRLINDLTGPDNIQAKNIAEIVQIVQPDVIALFEFDYDSPGLALRLFQDNYLGKGQNGQLPIHYDYFMVIPSNTGLPSGEDLNHDGRTGEAEDAFGFGRFPGQYAFAVLSKYPIHKEGVRSFQHFLWKDMPGALWPVIPGTGASYYSDAEKNIFRLSSKNHVDIPVEIPGGIIHLLVAHPTPPAFDGSEDRNGRRNHDEIRLFADYISGGDKAEYLYDDQGNMGGLHNRCSFVIMGDMNADPVAGDSYDHAINQLLLHAKVNQQATTGRFVPSSLGSFENSLQNEGKDDEDKGNPWHDTSWWGLRIDYIIPSKDIKVSKSGVFWPSSSDSLYYLIKDKAASDHLMVWMDIKR